MSPFEPASRHDYKHEAQRQAKLWRQQGYRVRVVKRKSPISGARRIHKKTAWVVLRSLGSKKFPHPLELKKRGKRRKPPSLPRFL